MKWLIIAFNLFTLSNFNNTNVVWENTYLEIALYEPLDTYFNMPIAKINVNGTIHYASFYKKGVNNTSITTVNSRHPQKHVIYYRAYFEELDIESTVGVVFDVRDIEPPVINYIPTFTGVLGEKIPTFKNYIQAVDDYDDEKDIIIDIDTSLIRINAVGKYVVTIKAYDKSGNVSTYYTIYEVIDNIPPEIKIIKDLKHPQGKLFHYEDYFKITDNHDVNININVDVSDLDIYKSGNYPITIIAKDQSNNETKSSFIVQVVDNEKPVIKLTTNPKPILVYTSITDELLKSFVVSVTDNEDILTVDNLIIDTDLDTERLGNYYIYYEVSDRYNNMATASIKVSVVDTVKPKIEVVDVLETTVFSSNFFYLSLFKITDNYDSYHDLTIVLSHKINLNVVGEYELKVTVTDKSKNEISEIFIFSVVDNINPEIIVADEILIDVFDDSYNYKLDVTASDNYDKKVTVIIDDSLVNYNIVGNYKIIIYASDLSGNVTEVEKEVTILDRENPTIIFKTKYIYTNNLLSKNDIKTYIDYIDDNYTKSEDLIILIEFKMDDLYEINTFTGTVTVIDEFLNETSEIFYVFYKRVLEEKYFNSQTVYVIQGENYKRFTNVDTNIDTSQIYVVDEHINTSNPGQYEIKYYYTNINGKAEEFSQQIIVNPTPKRFLEKYMLFIISFLIVVGGFFVLFYLSKKEVKNKTFFDNH